MDNFSLHCLKEKLSIYINYSKLTPWNRVLLEELTVSQLLKKFPASYGNRIFITAFTSNRHPSLSWARSIQFMPIHFMNPILISSSLLRLGLPSCLFPSGFQTQTPYAPLLSPIFTTLPTHLIRLDWITRIILGEEYWSFVSSLCSVLYFPVTSSLLGPNILLCSLFPNSLSRSSSLNMSDQVSHPYKTARKVIVLNTLIVILLDSKLEEKILHRMTASNPWFHSAHNLSLNIICILQCCSQTYELFHPFKGNIIIPYSVILSCILFSRREPILCFISNYF